MSATTDAGPASTSSRENHAPDGTCLRRTRRKRVPSGRWFYRLLVLAGPASVVALISGWVTTEVGRQPWVVYEVMRTTEAVTAADGIPVGYATMAAFYACLVVAVAWILRRLARAPMTTTTDTEGALRVG